MLDLFETWTHYLAAAIEVGAGLIIGLAVIQATARFLTVFFRSDASEASKEAIRLNLGRWLALALEFELAADILRTAVAPTWDEIGQLAAIIVLRTALNFFLQREIDRAAEHRGVEASQVLADGTVTVPPTDGVTESRNVPTL